MSGEIVMVGEHERVYGTGADMWRDYAANHGIDGAAGFCGRYLDRNMKCELSKSEEQFCKELFAAMFEAAAGIADPKKIVYPYELPDAVNRTEKSVYAANARHNADCARAVDDAINGSRHDTNYYNLNLAVMSVVRDYGFERVNAVCFCQHKNISKINIFL